MDEVLTLEEVIKATEQLKSGKAAGVDGIPQEIWKHGGKTLHSKLHTLHMLLGARKTTATSCFAEASQLFGLKVSLKKTEVLHQPAPRRRSAHPTSQLARQN